MSLLDTASLIVTPNGYKEGKLYSVIPSDGSGDLSVTRATTATRVNSSGLVELVPYNLVEYSEQFDNAAWTKLRATITANATTAPDGTLNADKIVENTDNNSHAILQAETNTSGQQYTVTIYAKADERNWFVIYTGGGPAQGRFFDLSNGTLGSVLANTPNASSITDAGNGWYRCSITYTATDTSTDIYFLTAISDGNNVYTGDGTSGLYLWGAQVVEGSSAKDYQKTETRLNIPRLDYSNGTCPSILVEPQRTNLLTYSSSFSNAAWVKFNASISANVTATLDPSGNYGASKIVEDSSSAFHDIDQVQTYSAGANTISVYAKSAGRNHIFLQHFDGSSFLTSGTFNLSNGTVSGNGNIESVGNGWYRCSFTATTVNGTGKSYINLSNGTSGNYQGDGTSGVYIWGAQLEAGSYATSYIPTTSASVTRNADAIYKTGISSLIGQTEGSVFLDFVFKTPTSGTSGTTEGQIAITDNSGDNRVIIWNNFTLNTLGLQIRANGTNAINNISLGSFVDGTRYKIAIGYKSGDTCVYVNGTQVISNAATFSFVSSLTNFILGGYYLPYDGHQLANASALWKTRLTNAQLATLTTI